MIARWEDENKIVTVDERGVLHEFDKRRRDMYGLENIKVPKKKIWIMDKDTAKLIDEYEKGRVEIKVDTGRATPAYPIKDITRVNPYFGVKNIIFNGPATIVMWTDGTKTVVKCHEEDFDKEKGLAMAICKKVMGNKGNYYNVIKKLLKAVEGEQ